MEKFSTLSALKKTIFASLLVPSNQPPFVSSFNLKKHRHLNHRCLVLKAKSDDTVNILSSRSTITHFLPSPSTLKRTSLLSCYFTNRHLFPSLLVGRRPWYFFKFTLSFERTVTTIQTFHFVQDSQSSFILLHLQTIVDPIISFFFDSISQAEQRARARIAPRTFEKVKPTACDFLSFIGQAVSFSTHS
jgi:hypothetical protein